VTHLTPDDLAGDMPESALVAALDDDRDGAVDEKAFRAALASANARAEAVFGGDVPARYARAADYAVRIFLLDAIHRRHLDSDSENPWTRHAEKQEARLRALASGTEAIDSSDDGVVIGKPAKVYDARGLLS